jgi:hypothetical protein
LLVSLSRKQKSLAIDTSQDKPSVLTDEMKMAAFRTNRNQLNPLVIMASRPRSFIFVVGIVVAAVFSVGAFTTSSNLRLLRSNRPAHTSLHSTPFDLDLYDDGRDLDESSNPFQPGEDDTSSPLAVDPSTKLVLGINKYSHDTTLCAANAETGEVLFALSKERITRKKHDGGNTAELVELCLDQLDLDLDSVVRVVMNNHHHRILPLVEANPNHMEWEEGLGINGGQEDGYSDEYNLLTGVQDKLEMSHHLAHAYSAAAQCPFNEGMIVVMDGMGETFRTMKRAQQTQDETFVSDFTICAQNGYDDIKFVPSDIDEKAKSSYFDWREAESVYTFEKDKGQLVVKVSVSYMLKCHSVSFYDVIITPPTPAHIQKVHRRKYPTNIVQPWI